MQKVVNFLEKYVQWVAIALGAAFLLWMIYGYVIQKPVTVTVAGSTLTPGQVDDKTLTGPVRNLETLIQANTAPPMPVQDFYTTLAQSLSEASVPTVAMNKPWTTKFYESSTSLVDEVAAVVPTRNDPVIQLPAAPAPTDLKTSDGRSTVTIPLPAAAGAPGAPAAPPVMGSGVDVNWITVGATIPVKKLADNFTACKIPAETGIVTTLLRVELQRQEQNGDGTWGAETVVEPLKNVTLLPLPGADSKPTEQYAYDIWAQGAQVDIAQPAYYPVIQGDAWRIPGGQVPIDAAAAAAEAAFDPSKVTNTRDLTPEQRKLYDAYQRQIDQAKKEAARQKYLSRRGGGGAGGPPMGGMPPGGGAPGGFGGGGAPDVAGDNSAPILLAQAGRPGYPPGMMPPGGGYPGGYPGGMPGMPPGMMPGMMPGMDGMPGMGQPGGANTAVDSANAALLTAAQASLPKGSFVPSAQPDIIVWAHDASVLPGKTYRYRVRYYMKNPVYGTSGVCKDPKLAMQFMLDSEYSDWTEAVSVKSVTNFYAVNASPTKDAVKFDIFRWKNGNWQVNSIEATPGDMVGAPKGDGADKVDFTTGWTLVDVRSDPRNADNKIIILTTDSGQTLRKDLQADRSNNEYKNLKSLIDKANPAAPGGPAGPNAGRPASPAASAGGQGGLFGDAGR